MDVPWNFPFLIHGSGNVAGHLGTRNGPRPPQLIDILDERIVVRIVGSMGDCQRLVHVVAVGLIMIHVFLFELPARFR